MDIFVLISLLGGLALFLYGMQLMSSTIKENASGSLKTILEKVAGSPLRAFFLGLVVTALIQSSKAAIVITAGLVGAGVLTYSQSLGIIVGANVGTTVTGQIFRLLDFESGGGALQLLQPSNFAPIALIIGVILVLFIKKGQSRAVGGVIMGFGILFTGLLNMTAAVDVIADSGSLDPLIGVLESSPVAGYLIGALTAFILQSSSASIGILQAFSATDRLTLSIVYIVILGIYLGDSVTTYLVMHSERDGDVRRVGLTHVVYTVFKSILCFAGINICRLFTSVGPAWDLPVSSGDIANLNTVFHLAAAALLFPCLKLIEKTVISIIKESPDSHGSYDEVLEGMSPAYYDIPALALKGVYEALQTMFDLSRENLRRVYSLLFEYSQEIVNTIDIIEDDIDMLSDTATEYITDLSPYLTREEQIITLNQYYKIISETEHLGDYSEDFTRIAGRMRESGHYFSGKALHELQVCGTLISELMADTEAAFKSHAVPAARAIGPLTEVGQELLDKLKDNHLTRLAANECDVQTGHYFFEILGVLERVMSSCDNIGLSILVSEELELTGTRHEYLSSLHAKHDEGYNSVYAEARERFFLLLEEEDPPELLSDI